LKKKKENVAVLYDPEHASLPCKAAYFVLPGSHAFLDRMEINKVHIDCG